MKHLLKKIIVCVIILLPLAGRAASILIPMDEVQKDHLKSYGVAFWVLQKGGEVDWLLNYRGGSFMTRYDKNTENECNVRNVSYEVVTDSKVAEITAQINDPSVNMDLVKLEKAPRMAVYSPREGIKPSDDAVILVLRYAEIPFDIIYDNEIMKGDLPKYDWLHLHHEDFTGQYSKSGGGRGGRDEYKFMQDKLLQEATAAKWGFKKVSKLKLAVAERIRDFCAGGGFLFAMCSGADSFDIALSAANTDIVEDIYDGDPADPNAQKKLDFTQTFAFQNFHVDVSAASHRFSDIDAGGGGRGRYMDPTQDFFTLFDFSAKWDVVPSMLTQDHERVIKGFRGLCTAFNMDKIKPTVTIMGETKSANEARYIHGEYGKGQWTFYGGHDPEGNIHGGGFGGGYGGGGYGGGGFNGGGGMGGSANGANDPAATNLALHPNSPGYRLILNNVLFPAAHKKKQKT